MSKDELTDLVINENQDGEWHGWYPPVQSVQSEKKRYFDYITFQPGKCNNYVYAYLSGYMRRPLSMPGV
jgi:hypothetical protein